MFFFFSSRRRHTRCSRDWSSDVCSSDLTLTMTAALGVNDDEIGAVVRYGLATPFVGGISIQPQFGSGRSAALDPRNRLTHTGVLARLEIGRASCRERV